LKNFIKYILQKSLGYQRYLYIFTVFKINTLKWDSKENDFFFFLSLLTKKGVGLDLGANLGIMSYYLCLHKNLSKVYAFEPIPSNIETLKKIQKKYQLNNLTIVEKALSDKNEHIEMILPEVAKVNMQGLSHVVHPSIKTYNEGTVFKVDAVTLDSYFESLHHTEPIVAIKIDVENFEYFVLLGGKNIIQKNLPIVYAELWENENRLKCFELMKALNYTINVVVRNEIKKYDASKHQHQNFIFIPKN
jgi:FkbM family methyltransferase